MLDRSRRVAGKPGDLITYLRLRRRTATSERPAPIRSSEAGSGTAVGEHVTLVQFGSMSPGGVAVKLSEIRSPILLPSASTKCPLKCTVWVGPSGAVRSSRNTHVSESPAPLWPAPTPLE